MSRRIATITLNPAYDLIGSCQKIECGDVNLVKTLNFHTAGKGINVAKVVKALGIDVTVGGLLGEENPDGFQQLFSQLGLTNRFQMVAGCTRVNVKLTGVEGGDTDFNFSGFNVSPSDWDWFVTDSLQWLNQFDMVAVCGSLPVDVELDKFSRWMVRLREACPRIIFDSSRETFSAGLKASPWLVKPNRRELEIWLGRELPTIDDVLSAANRLQELGVAHVVISLGAEGALWVTASGVWLAKPPACKIVSTVGAGDAMVGGLIYGLLQGESCEETLRLATAISALSISQSGVGVVSRTELAAMIARVTIERLC